jgi:broad specificity phosphatase PhoE
MENYLVVVRHGRTEWNLGERFRGRASIGLDEVGVEQAGDASRALARYQPRAIYASPLERAARTAGIIGLALGLEAVPLPQLIDMDFGDWTGLTLEEAAQKDGQLYKLWAKAPHRVKFPGGEGLADVRQRVEEAVAMVRERHPQDTVVLVSHKVVCKVLVLALLGWENSRFWQVEQDLAAISVFDFRSGRASALLINDTCHLKGL